MFTFPLSPRAVTVVYTIVNFHAGLQFKTALNWLGKYGIQKEQKFNDDLKL